MQDQLSLIVSGARYGMRNTSQPLSLREAHYRVRGMIMLGYEAITVVDAKTGVALDAESFAPSRRAPGGVGLVQAAVNRFHP